MSEDQIERMVQYRFDRLDARFIAGKMTEIEYRESVKAIDRWAEIECQLGRKGQ